MKDMYHYAILLLEKKLENIILHLGTNDAPYKFDTDILKDLIELKDFILERSPSCKRITLSTPTVRNDRENTKKSNENLTNRLKKQGISYIAHDNITHKHLYCDGLHLNSVGFSILTENFLSYIRTNWLQIETQNQRKNKEVSSSEITTENSDDIIDGLKTSRLKYPQNPIIAQINISSIRNKFEILVSLVTSDIDILTISETKIDESFPLSQFMIDGFSMPYRRDRNAHGGGFYCISEIILHQNY